MTDWPTIEVHEYEDCGQPVVPVTTLRFNGVSIPGGTYYLIPKDIIDQGTVIPRQTVYEHTTGQGPTYRSVEAHPQTMLCVPWEDTDD